MRTPRTERAKCSKCDKWADAKVGDNYYCQEHENEV